jgi:hypothetical protein
MMAEFRRATLAAVSLPQILVQIKSGKMQCHEDSPEESSD